MSTLIAEAIRGLVEFARDVSEDNDNDCNGWATPARAALEGWEKRPRLRQDDGVLLTLAKLVVAPGFTVEDAADALDALLFGERG